MKLLSGLFFTSTTSTNSGVGESLKYALSFNVQNCEDGKLSEAYNQIEVFCLNGSCSKQTFTDDQLFIRLLD